MRTVVAPWKDTLTSGEYTLIQFFVVFAGLALLAHLLRSWTSRSEVGPRYRPAVIASLCVAAVAFLSYVVLYVELDIGYDRDSSGDWVPNAEAVGTWAPRFMDWSVSVPLLMVELLAVSVFVGGRARRARSVAIGAAFLMIFAGFLGSVVIADGESLPALVVWGAISAVFMVVLYVLVIAAVTTTLPELEAEAARSFRNAMILLLAVWLVYPLVYGLQAWGEGGMRTTVMQVSLCIADVIAKVGFGALIHKVAKLRTAQDVASGLDEHPESVWTSSVKRSEARLPPPTRGSSSSRSSSDRSGLAD